MDKGANKNTRGLGQDYRKVSVIILNYNGIRWLDRCLKSIKEQTVYRSIEVIVVDNKSKDGSDEIAKRIINEWPSGFFIQNGENLGFCEGNNRGADKATGEFLFFINNDTWLEKNCIEELLKHVEQAGANAASPLIHNYESDEEQLAIGDGFDCFGLMSFGKSYHSVRDIFVAAGCGLLIRRSDFEKIGKFDPTFFMYCDEYDLSWRNWIAGGKVVCVPSAKLHHWGAADLNPQKDQNSPRTSYSKRYYSNRNYLLAVLKNGQHLLLLLCVTQLFLLCCEAIVMVILVRDFNFIKKAYFNAVADCWKSRKHVLAERKRISRIRKYSDWKMLRFLRLKPNRWDEFKKIVSTGFPTIVSK